MKNSNSMGHFRHFLLVVCVFATIPGIGNTRTIAVDLYVKSGVLETADDRTLPVLCFASSETGQAFLPNSEIGLEVGDELLVTLHNQDDSYHGFEVLGLGGAGSSVAPGSSETFQFLFPEAGCWLYRDPVNLPINQGLGLTGPIVVIDQNADHDAEFLWHLNEFSEGWLTHHEAGEAIDTAIYLPNYFTVNGRSGADTMDDPRALLAGQVGDNLLIHVVNGGLRLHSLHFHGYHVNLVWRDGAPLSEPWVKDTIAIPAGGTALFQLTPHQSGLFPIHDHVVQSVTANGVYPLGMIVFADIQP